MKKFKVIRWMSHVLWLCLASGCADKNADSSASAADLKRAVVARYAEIVGQSYSDLLTQTTALKTAVTAFVAAPSPDALATVRQAWLDARGVYGRTEAYRFYDGPIDAADSGPEPRINSWPLDEAYLDYVDGAPVSGLIGKPDFALTKESIVGLNAGQGGDVLGTGAAFDPKKAISTGFHAVEFLLWGQDVSDVGPGARPWQDFLVTPDATHPNGDRRGEYLRLVTEILVDDLTGVAAAWTPTSVNYRAAFVGGAIDDALRKILTGIGVLSKGELAGERIDVALDTLDQEDEHSCFSDNTHNDLRANIAGIQNVYLGRYAADDQAGIDELLQERDPALAEATRATIESAVAAVEAIPAPFDVAIRTKGGAGWMAANAAVAKLYDVGDAVVKVGAALGLGNISVDLPK